MATITSTPESIFFGSPLIYTVQSGNAPAGAAFHRIMLDVIVSGQKFPPLSRPATSGNNDFDISSCITAIHESYQYSPVISDTSYPVYSVTVTAYDVWVVDGREAVGGVSDTHAGQYIAGSYSDYERVSGLALSQSHSRKPRQGELVCVGDRIVYAAGEGLSPRSRIYNVIATAALGPITIAEHQYFVLPFDRNSRQFQFVNSRGCVESIRAFSRISEKASMENKETTFSIFERLRSLSRTYVNKVVKPASFSMSSGFVNYEWAMWWANEFCSSSKHWMLNNGRWIPVHVKVDDTTIIDRSKTELLHIDFSVSPDLDGALW